MANRYFFRLPYTCKTYGDLTGYVVAENEEEALDSIINGSTDDEEYSNEDSENYNYDYDEATFDIRESDMEPESSPNKHNAYPKYFLTEVNLI
jgi:hypothetical protein